MDEAEHIQIGQGVLDLIASHPTEASILAVADALATLISGIYSINNLPLEEALATAQEVCERIMSHVSDNYGTIEVAPPN